MKPLKAWVTEEALKCGVCNGAIYMRIYRGKYPKLKLKRLNQRVVFVKS